MRKIFKDFKKFRHRYLHSGNLFLFIALILAFLWTLSATSSLSRNWELNQRLNSRRRQLALLKLETETMELENQYYASAEYQELALRERHHKKFPGETLVYLPDNSPAAKTKYLPKKSIESEAPSNLQEWLKFLFGR